MGYNGMGYQRWIATMKPRKFLGKRTKPDGGGGESGNKRDIRDYFHLNPNSLENVNTRYYSPNLKKKLNKDLDKENENQFRYKILSILISIILVALLFWYFAEKFAWF